MSFCEHTFFKYLYFLLLEQIQIEKIMASSSSRDTHLTDERLVGSCLLRRARGADILSEDSEELK
jgi:hypothetical protein